MLSLARHFRTFSFLALLLLIFMVPAMSFDRTEKYLFLFAHPDDDAFICGTMKMLIDAGAEVHGVWLTSGDYFGKGELREGELARATETLGLKKSRVHLLRLPDLGLVPALDRAATTVAELFTRIRPDNVFVTAFEGGHPDHDSANFLAYEASRTAGVNPRIFEFPLYNGSGAFRTWRWRINAFPPGGPPTLHDPLNEAAVDVKYKIMDTYSSQWMYMIPAKLASPRGTLMEKGEPYRRCPADRDHTVQPHSGPLNYERWFNFFIRITFDDFRNAVLKTRRNPQ